MFNTIWKQKFVLIRNELEEIERDETVDSLIENIENKTLNVWNVIPENYYLHFIKCNIFNFFQQLIYVS